MKLTAKERLILSMDFEEKESALQLLDELKDEIVYCKVGLQLLQNMVSRSFTKSKGWALEFSWI
jgi:orotidine-5'-phosphate decarboxylase